MPAQTYTTRKTSAARSSNELLVGTSKGLYDASYTNPLPLWTDGEVKKILTENNGIFLLTSTGILFTDDLVTFEPRNNGLPIKTLKKYENGKKSFTTEIQDIKDLEILPNDSTVMVCATKDSVYLTRDAGKQWKKLGLSARTPGVKAVSVAMLSEEINKPAELIVFMSHPIYGISYIKPNTETKTWIDIPVGLELLATTSNPNEVSDMLAVSENGISNVYAAQSFTPRIYKLDWAEKKWTQITNPQQTEFADTYDGLTKIPGGLLYTAVNRLECMTITGTEGVVTPAKTEQWMSKITCAPGVPRCAYISPYYTRAVPLKLSELWLLDTGKIVSPYAERISGKKGIYLPVHQINYPEKYAQHRQTLKNNKLNMVVVDMKDDYGILRFKTENPLLKEKGKIGRTINLERFIADMKSDGIYLVARIVAFKDPVLASYKGGIYAVKDRISGQPWKGWRMVKEKAPVAEGETPPEQPVYISVQKEYDETWVDPYCEEVWEYNTEVARELIQRGFDEIQFDYIRFPTDGKNLNDAVYPWRDPGMDKESALMSFLSYARARINAPISIDIYGANGIYRSGVRTGQDVELIARYVDAICPMFYPNHFENAFLAYEPAVERPYRIYYYGTYRNAVIARNQVVVRPYAQAFYMGVAYDKQYYDNDYVQRQVFAIRDVLNRGYTYWNNSGRYDDLRPDPTDDEPYPWKDIPAESVIQPKPFLHTPKEF